jgi:hypothetical protein
LKPKRILKIVCVKNYWSECCEAWHFLSPAGENQPAADNYITDVLGLSAHFRAKSRPRLVVYETQQRAFFGVGIAVANNFAADCDGDPDTIPTPNGFYLPSIPNHRR